MRQHGLSERDAPSACGRWRQARLNVEGALVCALLLACTFTCSSALAARNVDAEIECLALTIYFEARGEPDLGKFAVGHVVMNRAADRRFPRHICEVVWQREAESGDACQFSWACDALSDTPTDMKAWRSSKAIARWIYFRRSRDPTGGALWYHADYVAPAWKAALEPGQRIGRHIFYRTRGPSPGRERRTIQVRAHQDLSFSSAIRQISQSVETLLPKVSISVLSYTDDSRTRFVRINKAVFHEGDSVAYGLTLDAILPDGIILRRNDRRIRIDL